MLADAGYGNDTSFRIALTEMELTYVMGVQGTVTVWKPGEEPMPHHREKATPAVPANSYSATPSTNRFPRVGCLTVSRGVAQRDLASGSEREETQSRFAACECAQPTATTGVPNRIRPNGC